MNKETVTFITKSGRMKVTVSTDFLKKCPNPEAIRDVDLITKHKMSLYFHNPNGPAVVRLEDNFVEFWIDGKMLNEEESKKLEHNYNFNNKLDSIIKDEN